MDILKHHVGPVCPKGPRVVKFMVFQFWGVLHFVHLALACTILRIKHY